MSFDRASFVSRIFGHVDAKLPDLADEPVYRSADTYTDPDRFQREVDHLFLHDPICVGYTGELPDPGDYKTTEIAGVPMIVIRGNDGEVRAFRNSCLHRGAPLLEADRHGEGLKRFSCPFHGWNYDNQGNLAAIPSKTCFPDLVSEGRTLGPIPVQEKYGLIFAVLRGTETPDIDRFLGAELAKELETYGWESMRLAAQETVRFRANWKLAVDSFGENYHVPYLHPTTIFPLTLAPSMAIDYFDSHVRFVFGMDGISELRDHPEQWGSAEVGRHLFPVYNVFPNLSLTVAGGALAAFQIFPGRALGECDVVYTKLLDPKLDPETRAIVEGFMDYNWNDVVKAQDLPIIEGVWRSLETGSCTEIIFGRNEAPVQHFHNAFDRAVAGAAPKPRCGTR